MALNVASLIEGETLKGDVVGVSKVAEYNDVGAKQFDAYTATQRFV
jgi:hypothetical protein